MEQVDCVVIGAGVVGLAIARALAGVGREVLILEAEEGIGTQTSSRNSEVIHAGIYYPPGSLKATLCVRGKALLYRFCEEYGVAHRRIGKLFVASTEAEVPQLEAYRRNAERNGVLDLVRLDGPEATALEPAVICRAGVLSPSTGIVDSHALMLALLGDAEHGGAVLAVRCPVEGGRVAGAGIELVVGGEAPMRLAARLVVNCAGLQAQSVARRIDGIPPHSIPPLYMAKGHYYTLSGKSPFRRLVYPMPRAGGLGVHVTLDLAGQARFGPDVSGWPDRVDYAFDESGAPAFYEAIRAYYPGLADGALNPGYTGIRPKLSGPGAPAADYVIQGPRDHGVPGWCALYGIESPGLTSSLAIAEMLADRVG